MSAHIETLIQYGYGGLFVLLAAGIVGLPVPDETLLTFAGYLAATGRWQLWPAAATSLTGIACGMTVNYGLGRTLGTRLVERFGGVIHVSAGQLDRVRRWFGRAGRWALVFGYFVPGVRHLTPLVAGSAKLRFAQFAPFAYAGALLWSATFLTVGYLLGEHWQQAMREFQRHRMIGVAAAAVIVALYVLARRRSRGLGGGLGSSTGSEDKT